MNDHDVRQALVVAGESAIEVQAIGDGWANWTFLIDGRLIVRFPRNDEVAQATQRELSLLPALNRHLSFEVPDPTVVGTWDGRPFFGYRPIEGRSLRESDQDLASALGGMLSSLHEFPPAHAADLIGARPPDVAWREHYEQLWPLVAEVALPELDRELADAVKRHFTEMVEHPPEFPTSLIHNDLGPVHVLIRHNMPVGMIDFEDAWLGDPATDLAPLVACLGRDALPALISGRDLGDRLDERIRFYRWMGSIHAVIYGVRERVDDERTAGVEQLRQRLPQS